MNSRIGPPVLMLSWNRPCSCCSGGLPWTTARTVAPMPMNTTPSKSRNRPPATILPAADRGVHDGELAHERAERGRARDGQEARQEQRPDRGTRSMAPRTSSVTLLP